MSQAILDILEIVTHPKRSYYIKMLYIFTENGKKSKVIYLDLVSMETSLQPLTASLFFQVPSSAHEILYVKEEEYL